MAAGFGSWMLPATKETPKPLVEVNGKQIIEILLDALVAAEIKDITVIVGYQQQLLWIKSYFNFGRFNKNKSPNLM